MTTKEKLIEMIASNCNMTTAEAEENLNGSMQYLQELKLEHDLRNCDIQNECEGFLSVRYNHIFMMYAAEQTDMLNIPEELKKLHCHEDDEDFEDNSEFNPYDYAGFIGFDLVQEIYESMY